VSRLLGLILRRTSHGDRGAVGGNNMVSEPEPRVCSSVLNILNRLGDQSIHGRFIDLIARDPVHSGMASVRPEIYLMAKFASF